MSEFTDAVDEAVGPGWRRFGTFVAVMLAIYLVAGLIFGLWPFSSAARAVSKVTSAESIIQNYEWFYDQYNAIQAQQANIKTMPAGASELPGMNMVLNNSIAEYNSKSRQITRNMWKAKDLPYQIEIGGAK